MRTRVLVVEDSLTVRKRLVEVLSGDPELEVVAEAEDGSAAIERCRDLRPDAVTMDMTMPVMSGLAATEYIMAHFPTPILIVSASTNRGELYRMYDALSAGAVDVLEKRAGDGQDAGWEERLIAGVKMVARIKVITHPRGRLAERPGRPAPSPALPSACRVVAIGASTGGPAAVSSLLQALPPDFPLPVLVVIHIGAPFAPALADWLDSLSNLRVATAQDGERLPVSGRVLMAPPDRHLVLQDGRLRLSAAPERHSCRPSVDVLFESLAVGLPGAAVTACLLTGMGRDGAEGLLAIRRAGGTTIAQDEASSIVYGMPREAALLGAAQRVLPLPAIAAELAALRRTP